MGTAVARAPRMSLSRRASTTLAITIGVALVAVLAYHRVTTNDITFTRDAIVGALCALIVYALRCGPLDDAERDAERAPSWMMRPFLALAGFGYTLYLVHEPPLAFLREWIIARPHHRWTPTLAHVAAGIAIVVAIVIYAYAISLVTEAQTDRVRAWLQRRLAAWHPSLAPAARAAHRLAEVATEATEGIAPAPTWQTTAES
jgi:peptidoglycan/LPS O-acetylase OafA/YrhL